MSGLNDPVPTYKFEKAYHKLDFVPSFCVNVGLSLPSHIKVKGLAKGDSSRLEMIQGRRCSS